MSTAPLYRELIESELKKRIARNPRYSLRSFARDLGLSPSVLSEVLKQKKGFSQRMARQVSKALGLSRLDTASFLQSVAATHARSKEKRLAASEKLKDLQLRKGWLGEVSAETLGKVQHWYYFAILELLELEQFEPTEAWIADRLGLKRVIVSKALETLVQLGWIERRQGRLAPAHRESETTHDIPSESIKAFHREMLGRAEKALFRQGVSEREFLNMTFAFDKAKIQEAKEMIRAFRDRFAEKLYSPDGAKDSVYQLSVQFFRQDR